MILYFSGTGNSLWVAEELGKAFNESLISISSALKIPEDEIIYHLQPAEKIFFVFPVHSWGPAVLVRRFIDRLRLEGYSNQAVYSVCTCGDECGYTEDILEQWLKRKNIKLTGSYSVVMPNNYILLPGFDVDTEEVEKEKLQKAPAAVELIVQDIRTISESRLYKVGGLPFLKSRMIYPLFARFALRNNSFYATDACISCGICVKSCPTGTIQMQKGEKPVWRKDSCVQCVACIHFCPERAIEYGNISRKKGRYHHPGIKTIK